MYKNKALQEHAEHSDGDDDDFDMESVIVPELAWKPHAENSAYRSQVGIITFWSYFLSDYNF